VFEPFIHFRKLLVLHSSTFEGLDESFFFLKESFDLADKEIVLLLEVLILPHEGRFHHRNHVVLITNGLVKYLFLCHSSSAHHQG
jgi:hypothetical protein